MAGQEIAVADAVGAGEEPADIHHRAPTEQDPVRVEQEHDAIRGQRAEYVRWAETAGDPLESDTAAVGLVDVDLVAAADIERGPVGDRPVRVRLNRHRIAGARDRTARAADELAASRKILRE